VAVVLQGDPKETAPEDADYVLVSETIELPRGGKLGVMLDTSGDRLVVSAFVEDSAAKDVGILDQDQIVALEGKPIANLADLKVVLIDKRPGDVVSVVVERACNGETPCEASFSVTLR
jgi:S1-C subfamily serine protease